jgi:hypothetical protein
MSTVTSCESCGMPLSAPEEHARGAEAIPYCVRCTTESGELQSFEERLERMTQWSMRTSGLNRAAAHARTLDRMRTMPARRDHPSLGRP